MNDRFPLFLLLIGLALISTSLGIMFGSLAVILLAGIVLVLVSLIFMATGKKS